MRALESPIALINGANVDGRIDHFSADVNRRRRDASEFEP
jgi:hypothetical protein